MMSHPLLLIPARMASTRLPGKPLADIAGRPMIVHVWERAMQSGVGPVAVACSEHEVARAIESAGGVAVMTDPDHPSGSDRIYEALQKIDPEKKHDVVINLQGDMPTLDPAIIRAVMMPMADPAVDIATLCAPIRDAAERTDPAVVKPVIAFSDSHQGRALYFTRATAPHGDGPLYHHIGMYAYRRAALEKFIALGPSPLENREKLEQLRALEHGMRIEIRVVDTVPLGVDTPETLEKARRMLG